MISSLIFERICIGKVDLCVYVSWVKVSTIMAMKGISKVSVDNSFNKVE